MKYNKYKNKKAVVYTDKETITFDSQKEKKRFYQLKLLEESGVISNLKRQVKYELLPSFKYNGETIRAVNYIADFEYYDREKKQVIIEDVKGFRTKEYIIKKKLLLNKILKEHGKFIDFKEI